MAPWDGQGKPPWSSYLQRALNPTGPLRLIYLQNDSQQSGTADDQQVKPPCAMSPSLNREDWKAAGSFQYERFLRYCLVTYRALVRQPVSTVGSSDDKSFIFFRAFFPHTPCTIPVTSSYDWLTAPAVKSYKILLRQYQQTPIDPTGMDAYSKGNKQTKENKQLGAELH